MPFKPLLALSLLAGASVAAQGNWNGRYVYHESLGRDAGGAGTAVSREHRLTIAPGRCRLRATGYQTDMTIVCRAFAVGAGKLAIRFVSFGDGRSVNQYGVARYRAGEPLLILSRDNGRIVTDWQGYTLDDDTARPGIYFRRG